MATWSDLPPELLDLVADWLDSASDTRRFRSVCTTWRSAVPSRDLPLQFPPIKFLTSDHCDLRPAKNSFFHLSLSSDPNSTGWVIKTQEHEPGSFHLFNPFSRTFFKHLPPNFPKILDLTNIKIRELGHEYVLRNMTGGFDDLYDMEHEKVALLFVNNSDYVILSTHNTGKLLMYWSAQKKWAFLDDFTLGYDDRSIFVNDWSLYYVDVVEFDGIFYAVTNSGRTVSISVVGSHVTVTLLKKSIIGGDKKCLVKLADDLLMVDLYTDTTPGLVKVHAVEIFKLDKEEKKWVLVKSLGEYAIFLSNHSSFSAIGVPGCKTNCIYFHFKNLENKGLCYYERNKEDDYDDEIMDDFIEMGVFDFEKGIVGSLDEYMEDKQLFSCHPPSWITMASNI